MTGDAPALLRTLLGDYPHTAAVKSRALATGAVQFEFAATRPVHAGFAAMARTLAFDLSELAIVTTLQAIERGVPLVLLPAVLSSRFQRDRIIALADGPFTHPSHLEGEVVGVRAYTQTTGMWVRAALWEDHGVAIDSVRWRTSDPAHVSGYVDPPFVEHDVSGKSLPEQLRAGEIAAAIMGSDLPEDPEFVRVFADHREADQRAFERQGFRPPNHVLTATSAAIEQHPEAIRAAYALLRQAAADVAPALAAECFGVEAMRAPLAYTIEEALRQRLIERRFSAEELLAPAARLLDG